MTGRENEDDVKLPSLGWLAERADIVEEFLHYARSQGVKAGRLKRRSRDENAESKSGRDRDGDGIAPKHGTKLG